MALTEEEEKSLKALLARFSQDSKDTQDPKTGEDKPQDPVKGEEAKSNQAKTINPHKYERDIANRDKRIAELQAALEEKQNAEKTDSEKLLDLEKRQDDLIKQLKNEKITSKLVGAGCLNSKAAMALLDDYEGDISKLKEGNPYLFEAQTQ